MRGEIEVRRQRKRDEEKKRHRTKERGKEAEGKRQGGTEDQIYRYR
jgi:hypothetical protein